MVKMGRSAYRIPYGNGYIVRKSQPMSQGALQKFFRAIFGGSLPFQNEKLINELLGENTFTNLHYPKLLNISNSGDYEFEYIEGKDLSAPEKMYILKAMNGLLDFNSLGIKCRRKGIKWIALRLLESPTIRTAKIIMMSDLSFTKKLSGIWLILSQCIKPGRPCTVLLHNDLLFSNLRIGDDGNIYFLDFEDSIPESLMVLSDAIDLLLDRTQMSLDMTILRNYWERLANRLGVDPADLDLGNQIRLCLLRLSVAGRSRSSSSEAERRMMEFMCNTVLDKDSYNRWYQKQARLAHGTFTEQ